MESGGLLLLLGSLALWAELLAAPAKDSAAASPLSQVSDAGTSRPGQIPSKEEGSVRPSAVEKGTNVLRTGPGPGGNREPQDPWGSKGAGMGTSEEGLASRDPLLSSGEAKPGLTETPAQNQSPGKSTSAEKAQEGPARNHLFEKSPSRGAGAVSGGEEALSTVGSPGLAAVELLSSTGSPVCEDKKPASEGQPAMGDKPVSDILRGSSTSPASRETPGPRGGPARPSKSLCGGKPATPEKPPSDKAPVAEASPSPDTKPPSGEKPTPTDKPTSGGGKPPPEHGAPGKPVPAGKPAPHDKPGSSEKPAAKEQPEEDAGGDGDDEDSPQEDAGDDADAGDEDEEEEEEEEGDGQEEGKSIFSEDEDEGSKHFDDELDYGLHRSPFNSDEYHDWWGGGSEEELDAKPEGDAGGLSEEGDADAHEEPVFDVWGDLVEKGAEPEA
uniref:Uncharacterized protein n=1 Tax=Sphaerodactylus townsendi TaxID=933632 RepID=A0ACB8F792_9SAUR